jgi:hypothetical protein
LPSKRDTQHQVRQQQHHSVKNSFLPLSSYASHGEWIHVHCNCNLYLEECVNPPTVKRDKDGWRYKVLLKSGVKIRKGPLFSAEPNGSILQCIASILIKKQVIVDGEAIWWLRLKDSCGFINFVREYGEIIVAKKLEQEKCRKRWILQTDSAIIPPS